MSGKKNLIILIAAIVLLFLAFFLWYRETYQEEYLSPTTAGAKSEEGTKQNIEIETYNATTPPSSGVDTIFDVKQKTENTEESVPSPILEKSPTTELPVAGAPPVFNEAVVTCLKDNLSEEGIQVLVSGKELPPEIKAIIAVCFSKVMPPSAVSPSVGQLQSSSINKLPPFARLVATLVAPILLFFKF